MASQSYLLGSPLICQCPRTCDAFAPTLTGVGKDCLLRRCFPRRTRGSDGAGCMAGETGGDDAGRDDGGKEEGGIDDGGGVGRGWEEG